MAGLKPCLVILSSLTFAITVIGCGKNAEGEGVDTESSPNMNVEIPEDVQEAQLDNLYIADEETVYEPVDADQLVTPLGGSFEYKGKTEVAVVKPLAFSLMEQYDYAAPDGKVLQAFKIDISDFANYEMTVRVDDRTLPLIFDDLERTGQFVVLTDPDDEVLLDFDIVAGTAPTQTLNLTTGERASLGVLEDFYSGKTVSMPEPDFDVTTDTIHGPVYWRGSVAEVRRTPWDEDNYWADPEKGELSWLIVTLAPNEFFHDSEDYTTLRYKSTEASLQDDEGNMYEYVTTTGSALDGNRAFWFKVPAGGTGYQVTLDTVGGTQNFTTIDFEEIHPSVTIAIDVIDE